MNQKTFLKFINAGIPKIIMFLLCLELLVIKVSVAYGQIPVAAPHRGIVQTCGDYRIELVRGPNRFVFYILDKNNRMISTKGASGIAVIQFFDNTAFIKKLTVLRDGGLYFSNTKSGIIPSLTLNITLNAKSIMAVYKNVPGIIQKHHHGRSYGKE